MTGEKTGRVMGLDLGEKTIGVALSDELGILASPLKTIMRTSLKKDFAALAQIVEENDIQKIIVGLPLHMDGQESLASQETEKFCNRLKGRVRIPIITWDERWSTIAAERALVEGGVRRKKRKDLVDKVAAALILQGWLDAQ